MADVTTSSIKADPTELISDKGVIAPDDKYAHGARLAAIVVSLMLGMFLVALDNVGLTKLVVVTACEES